jgi:hypothetical protein
MKKFPKKIKGIIKAKMNINGTKSLKTIVMQVITIRKRALTRGSTL